MDGERENTEDNLLRSDVASVENMNESSAEAGAETKSNSGPR